MGNKPLQAASSAGPGPVRTITRAFQKTRDYEAITFADKTSSQDHFQIKGGNLGKTFTIKTPDYIKPYKSVGVKLLPELRSSPHGVFYTRLQSQSTDSGMPQPPSPLLTPFMKSEVPRNPQVEMGTNSLPTEQRDWRVLGLPTCQRGLTCARTGTDFSAKAWLVTKQWKHAWVPYVCVSL